MAFYELLTERLRIRLYQVTDAEDRFQMMRACFPNIKESYEETVSWVKWTIDSYKQLERLYQPPYGDYVLELLDDKTTIGSVGIVPALVAWGSLEAGASEAEAVLLQPEFGLFWGVLPAFQKQGYASEAATRLIQYLFENQQARRVIAHTDHDNLASQAVMKKAGMRLYHNQVGKPEWFQSLGVIENPAFKKT